MTLEEAMETVDDNLPDGAWFMMLSEMTGIDPGDLAGEIYALAKRKGWLAPSKPKARKRRKDGK